MAAAAVGKKCLSCSCSGLFKAHRSNSFNLTILGDSLGKVVSQCARASSSSSSSSHGYWWNYYNINNSRSSSNVPKECSKPATFTGAVGPGPRYSSYLRWSKKRRGPQQQQQGFQEDQDQEGSWRRLFPPPTVHPCCTAPRHLLLIHKPSLMSSSEKLRQTTLKIRKTKDRMREKMEEIIQRENVMTIPNVLCVTRIALSPVLGYLVLTGSYEYALGIFVFAGVTDLLDGFIARQFPSQQSMLGSFLDPMADKFLVALLFLSLTAAEMIPIPLTMLIVARDTCLMLAGFYIRYLSLPPPKTLGRYFDVTHATARLTPTFLSKINTSIQLSLVACTLAAPVFNLAGHPGLHLLWYITAWTTISSGLSYVFGSDTFHLLRKNRHRLTNENMLVRNKIDDKGVPAK